MIQFVYALLCLSAYALKTIHIVPHTHCDPGWQETFDYYYREKVKNIFPNIISILESDLDRRFTWSDVFFFEKWYNDTTAANRARVRVLIDEKRLEFVGGGYVQHDEALSDLDNVILQIDSGHRFFTENKFKKPSVAWQIGPFGHSSITPSIFRQFGYDYLVINRVQDEWKEHLAADKNLEFIWVGADLGGQEEIFTHLVYDNYKSPQFLNNSNFWSYCLAKSGQPEERLAGCANELIKLMETRSEAYRSESIMLLFGNDYEYADLQKAEIDFDLMDDIMKYIHENTEIQIRYSTPSEYFDDVLKHQMYFDYYQGDFFPFSNMKEEIGPYYWTGFYSSRPDLKKKIRFALELNRATNILSGLSCDEYYNDSMAGFLLHDTAITGTCQPKVIESYEQIIHQITDEALEQLSNSIDYLIAYGGSAFLTEKNRQFIAYNALNWDRTELFNITTPTPNIEIRDHDGSVLVSQAIPISEDADTEFLIFFKANIQAHSITVFEIIEHFEPCNDCAFLSVPCDETEMITDYYEVMVTEKGLIQYVKYDNDFYEFNQNFFKFGAGPRSGTIIFEPISEGYILTGLVPVSFRMYEGPVLVYLETKLERAGLDGQNIVQKIILANDEPKFILEVTHFADEDEEVMIILDKPEDSRFFTFNSVDVHEREYQEVEQPEDIGQNFYPIPAALILGHTEKSVIVLPEYPCGAGLMQDSVLLHLHRDIRSDDHIGLETDLVDNTVVTQRFDLVFGDLEYPTLWKNYIEKTTPVFTFSVDQLSPLMLSFWEWSEPHAWPYKTHTTFGFNDNDVYLSSIGINAYGEKFFRVKNIRGKPAGMDFYWVNNPEYLTLDGSKCHEEIHAREDYIAQEEICFHDCQFVRPAGLPDIEKTDTATHFTINFQENQLLTFKEYAEHPPEPEEEGIVAGAIDFIKGNIVDQFTDLFDEWAPFNRTEASQDFKSPIDYFNEEEIMKFKAEMSSILSNLTANTENLAETRRRESEQQDVESVLVIVLLVGVLAAVLVAWINIKAGKSRVE